MKPYQAVPIQECDEPLLALPPELARVLPHPYQRLGAPYGEASPFQVRLGVAQRLATAQTWLRGQGAYQLQIFDAYRPVAVQQFMVDWTFQDLALSRGVPVTAEARQALQQEVFRFWAVPSLDLATPPPHSTGGAVDLTLLLAGEPVAMGSPIDEVSQRSYPNYFQNQPGPYHTHRCLLAQAMACAGFVRHPQEWWHFSYGDQLWAWLEGRSSAVYGRYCGSLGPDERVP